MGKYTIGDIARMAGVSQATVSRVMSGSPNVRPETRARVEEIISSSDYRPSSLARGLARGNINIVGIVSGTIQNPFYASIVSRLQKLLSDESYFTMLLDSPEKDEKVEAFLSFASQFSFEGIIVATPIAEHFHEQILSSSCPVVSLNSPLAGASGSIIQDEFYASYTATKHLLGLGHARVALLCPPEHYHAYAQRKNGYIQALNTYSIPYDKGLVFCGEPTIETGYEIGIQYTMGINTLPTAVFACNDMMALGFLKACFEKGVEVPREISIIGYDDIFASSLPHVGLTTVGVPLDAMCKNAADMLLTCMSGQSIPSPRIVFEPKLIERATTAPPFKK